MIRPSLTPRGPDNRAGLVACALLLCACATGAEIGDIDASVKDPFGPDASIGEAPYGVLLYLRGTFNDFDTSYPLGYEGNSRYTAVVPLTAGAHELKVADAGYAAGTTFSLAADRALPIDLDTPTALTSSPGMENNIQLSAPESGTYRFELSAANRATPVLLVSLVSRAPYREALYLRGSFNDFDTSTPFPFQGSNRYLAELALEAGTHRLKVADAGFSEATSFTLSATEPATLPIGEPTPLTSAPGEGNDIVLELAETGTYRFEMFASNLATPLLQVSLAAPAPYGVPMYVRGSFNDFDTSLRMLYREQDVYTASVALDTGSHGFKIADEGFTAERTFSASATQPVTVELDRDITLVSSPGMDNETRVAAARAGTYALELTVEDPAAPVLRVRLDAPAPYPVDLYVRGSFNGFDPVDRMRYLGDSRYAAVVALEAGSHALKIADAGLSEQTTFSVDAAGPAGIALDTPTTLEPAPGTGNDTVLDIAESGAYRFELTAGDAAAPVLVIARDSAAGASR